MKIKSITTILLVLMFLDFCATKEIPKADDFSFVFEEYACGSSKLLNYLDTSTGILVHTPPDETVSVEIPFVLSESQIETIYQEIISTNYFEYPSEVIVPGEVPFATFHLKVINGDFTNDVKWTDNFNFEPNFPEDDGLVELFYLIRRIIRAHPDYPRSEPVCA